VQGRTGNRAPFTSPRNLYESADGRWIAISASAQSIAERLMRMIGQEHYLDEPWFADHVGRLDHIDELDEVIERWIGARSCDEVLAASEEYEVAAFPVYTAADIAVDAQYLARQSFTTVADDQGVPVRLQNVIPLLSETPGRHRWLGPAIGAHNREVLVDELGYSEADLARWAEKGIVAPPPPASDDTQEGTDALSGAGP
jgi:crotonobetainyl-CoA:carnitine CoA-transferase CaiB-like acyl-CoA transferase